MTGGGGGGGARARAHISCYCSLDDILMIDHHTLCSIC